MHFSNYAAFAALFVHCFNWKFETLFFFWGWIVFFVLKFWAKKSASCSYKIVLI